MLHAEERNPARLCTEPDCNAYRMRDRDKCYLHSMTPEARSRHQAQAAKAKRQRMPFDEAILVLDFMAAVVRSEYTPERAAEVLAPMLGAWDSAQVYRLENALA